MITGVGSVAVLVHDAKKSAVWYRDRLGFEIVRIEGHTVFVKPKDSQALCYTFVSDANHGSRTSQEGVLEFGFNAEKSPSARMIELARSYQRATPRMLRGRTSS